MHAWRSKRFFRKCSRCLPRSAELVERVIDSLDDDEVELSADELAQLGDAAMDADRAAERGELLPQDEVLGYMRQISSPKCHRSRGKTR